MNERTRIRLPLRLWAGVAALLLVAPTLVVIPLSFTDKRSFAFPIEGWSLQWYENFFTDSRWLNSLGTSLGLALIVGVVATAAGTLAALGIRGLRARLAAVTQVAIMLPILVPGIVAAIAIFGMYLRWGLAGSPLGIALAHIALAIPFVIIPVGTALRGLDETLVRAAAVLGAGPLARFAQVQFPILLPGIVTGFIFAFVTSLDEVVVAYFLQSPTVRTLPVQMYSSVTVETDPSIAAASTLLLVLSTLIILIPRLVQVVHERRAEKRLGDVA
ncbi:ABC transporter permease [Leucobacter luti]|uniref:Putative spermidine/putrescine transport system permease protein n=1 Tax=Leucobacter luti TaxID=340320 RepID=A0A4Q7TRV4_9MICO|nr:ABC transporter permease [Leucobacter luti]MBL3699824.1 ABC transporter permease [Leucobacter luti]RZT62857.1 putative spermidine/putrescine transport system permease protein [Leucobacter luti]